MRFLWALLCLLCLHVDPGGDAKRQNSGVKDTLPTRKPKSKFVPGSGELTTKDGHHCTWKTSGEGAVALQVSCRARELEYLCRYDGLPDLCPAYGAKSSQYWKQVIDKLKKKRNACNGEKVLKARVCKKGPVEAHMKLAEKSEEKEDETKAEGKEREKDGGKRRQPAPGVPEGSGKEKEEKNPLLKEGGVFGEELNDGNAEMEASESYCAEGWQSVCSFFVNFFDG